MKNSGKKYCKKETVRKTMGKSIVKVRIEMNSRLKRSKKTAVE